MTVSVLFTLSLCLQFVRNAVEFTSAWSRLLTQKTIIIKIAAGIEK